MQGHTFSASGFVILYSSMSKNFSIADRNGKIVPAEFEKFLLRNIMGYGFKGFSEDLLIIRKVDKWGCFDTTGHLAIPLVWDVLLDFNRGYGIGKQSNDFYIIDSRTLKENKIQIPEIIEMKHFQEGLAPFKNIKGLEGYIDTTGNIAIAPEFKQVGYFEGGLAWAKDIQGLIGFINTKGEWVIKPRFQAAGSYDKESGMAKVKYEDEWAYVNDRDDVIRFKISEITDDFHNGLAKGKLNDKFGFYNNKGEWVIGPNYEDARDFNSGYAAVRLNDLWGFMNKEGKWVIDPKFEAVKDAVLIR